MSKLEPWLSDFVGAKVIEVEVEGFDAPKAVKFHFDNGEVITLKAITVNREMFSMQYEPELVIHRETS